MCTQKSDDPLKVRMILCQFHSAGIAVNGGFKQTRNCVRTAPEAVLRLQTVWHPAAGQTMLLNNFAHRRSPSFISLVHHYTIVDLYHHCSWFIPSVLYTKVEVSGWFYRCTNGHHRLTLFGRPSSPSQTGQIARKESEHLDMEVIDPTIDASAAQWERNSPGWIIKFKLPSPNCQSSMAWANPLWTSRLTKDSLNQRTAWLPPKNTAKQSSNIQNEMCPALLRLHKRGVAQKWITMDGYILNHCN